MNRVYEFALKLKDLVSPTLARVSATYSQTVTGMERQTSRIQSAFAKAGQSVEQLKRKLSFGKEIQSVNTLNAKLDGLTKRRNISVDSSEIKRLNKEIGLTERKLAKLKGGGGSGGGGSGVIGMIGASGLGGAAIGASLVAGAWTMLNAGMSAEQTKLAYTQFAGDKAGQVYQGLNTFANQTAFSNEEILAGGRTMLAAGYRADEIVPMANTVGNIAAGAGKNYGDLIASVAKIKQKGFVDGGELHQEFGGTPLMEVLQKNLGVDGEELFKMAEAHKIKYSDLVKAMVDMTTGKGIFAGYLEKDMNTTKGKLSTFLGTLMFKISQLGEALNPIISLILEVGSGLLDALDPVFTAIMNLFKAFSPLFQAIGSLLKLLGIGGEKAGLLTLIMQGLAGAINLVAWVVNLLATGIQYLVESPIALFLVSAGLIIMNLGTIVGWFGILIGWVTTAFTWIVALAESVWAFSAALLACPAVWIVAAIAVIVAGVLWLWDNCEGFRHALIKLWEVAKAVFGSIGKAWNALMQGDFAGVGKAFAEGIQKGMANAAVKITADKASRAAGKAPKVPAAPGLNKPAMPSAPGAGGAGGAGGKKDGIGKAAGLDATTGGTKSTTITINLKSLVERLNINAGSVGEGVKDMEGQVTDALLRVLNSANSMSTQ
ncbi:tape measure protein [Spirosoma areae]